MKRISYYFSILTPEAVRDLAHRVVKALTEHNAFPGAPVAPLDAAREALDDNLNRITKMEAELAGLRAERVTLVQAVVAQLTATGLCIEGAAQGEESRLNVSGFNLISPRGTALLMPQVLELQVKTGKHAGELKLRWRRVRGARSYEVQLSTRMTDEASWTHAEVAMRAGVTLKGLPPNATLWVRVRALGCSDKGQWSEACRGRIGAEWL